MENLKIPTINDINKSVKHDRALQQRRILIVEDDLSNQPLWQYIIDRVGNPIKHHWATNIQEAEELIEKNNGNLTPFDLIISDIFLPGPKTGLDLWERHYSSQKGKIILVSGIEQNEIMNYIGKQQGRPTFLSKPIAIDDSIITIYNLLNRE